MNEELFHRVMVEAIQEHRDALESIGYDPDEDDLCDMYNAVVDYEAMMSD